MSIPHDDLSSDDADFSLSDVVKLCNTTEANIRLIVAQVYHLPAEGPFSFNDFLRANRILGPVLEPY